MRFSIAAAVSAIGLLASSVQAAHTITLKVSCALLQAFPRLTFFDLFSIRTTARSKFCFEYCAAISAKQPFYLVA